MSNKPKWLTITDQLLSEHKLFQIGGDLFDNKMTLLKNEPHTRMIPKLALLHLMHSLEISMYANERGKHAIAISLIRHCIEAITLVDVGLQEDGYSLALLNDWAANKKSHGELRASLHKKIWSRYGFGLWDENWNDFFKNLSQAVQPYAHYTDALSHWQWVIEPQEMSGNSFYAIIGPHTYDKIKASRITLLHSLCVWTLGRLYLENKVALKPTIKNAITELGASLSESKLLLQTRKEDWGLQLSAVWVYKSDSSWIDE